MTRAGNVNGLGGDVSPFGQQYKAFGPNGWAIFEPGQKSSISLTWAFLGGFLLKRTGHPACFLASLLADR